MLPLFLPVLLLPPFSGFQAVKYWGMVRSLSPVEAPGTPQTTGDGFLVKKWFLQCLKGNTYTATLRITGAGVEEEEWRDRLKCVVSRVLGKVV